MFSCVEPPLNNAPKLAQGPFQGVLYRCLLGAQIRFSVSAGATPFSLQDLQPPSVGNVALLFSGNSALRAAASQLPSQKPSNMLTQDYIRNGVYGLFAGASAQKMWILIVLPAASLIFCVTLLYCLKRHTNQSIVSHFVCETLAEWTSWQTEHHLVKRILKELGWLSMYLFPVALFGALVYMSVILLEHTEALSCVIWNIDVSSLRSALKPLNKNPLERESTWSHWLIISLPVLLNAAVFRGLSLRSRSAKYARDSRAIFRVLHHFAESHAQPKRYCLDHWKLKLQADMRKHRGVIWQIKLNGYRLVHVILYVVAVVFLCMPGFTYVMNQSVRTQGFFLEFFGNPLVVSACNALLGNLVLVELATRLTKFKFVYLRDGKLDVIKFNCWRVETSFFLEWIMRVLGPVVSLLIFEESCLRYYLKFAPSIDKVMDYWDIGQTGVDAYRRGFCLSKLVSVFSPVWCMDICLTVFVTPSIDMLLACPTYTRTLQWLQIKFTEIRQRAAEKIKKLDADGDGKLSKEEWLAGGQDAADFDQFDQDGNGMVDKHELEAFVLAKAAQQSQAAPSNSSTDAAPSEGSEEHDQSGQTVEELEDAQVIEDVKQLEKKTLEEAQELSTLLSQLATMSAFGIMVRKNENTRCLLFLCLRLRCFSLTLLFPATCKHELRLSLMSALITCVFIICMSIAACAALCAQELGCCFGRFRSLAYLLCCWFQPG